MSGKNTRDFFTKAERRAQSDLKHAILGSYLGAFVGKTGSTSPGGRVGYLDGYAGPGGNVSGSTGLTTDGSPRIALNVAEHMTKVRPPKHLECIFVEAKKKYFDELDALAIAAPTKATARYGDVKDHLDFAIAEFKGLPALFFLDPFGVGLDRATTIDRVLKRPDTKPTELLLNFSLEAARRMGPFIRTPPGTKNRDAIIKTMTDWLGGEWWKPIMLTRDADGSYITPDAAATMIAVEYASQVSKLTGCGVMSVELRKNASVPALFSLMLFHPRTAARYPYNEAVSLAQEKWYEAMLDLEIAASERDFNDDPAIGWGHVENAKSIKAMSKTQAALDLEEGVYANLKIALAKSDTLSMKSDFAVIFDGVVGKARGTHFRKAWDRLAKEGIAEKRVGTDYEHATVRRVDRSLGPSF